MADQDDAPGTVTLRVARVVYLMMRGRWLTTAQVAEMTGLGYNGAFALLERLSASEHVPVTCVRVGPGRAQHWGIMDGAGSELHGL